MDGQRSESRLTGDGVGQTRRALLGTVIAGAATAVAGCLVSGDVERETATEQYTVSGEKVDRIAVSGADGDISIEGGDSTAVQVEATTYARGKTDLSEVRVTRDVFDGRLEVGVDVAPQVGIGAFGGGVEELNVRVPRDVDVERVDADDGHVTVSDVSGDMELTADDASADIGPLDGALSVSLGDGTVTAGAIDRLSGEVDDGRLTMTESAEVGDITGDDADLELAVSGLDGDATVQCDDGRIDARLDDTLDATVVVEADRDTVSVQNGVFDSFDTAEGTIRGRVGDGQKRLTLDVDDGDVRIHPV